MTYFPSNVFKHILSYTDDRVEQRQRLLWDSIKVKPMMHNGTPKYLYESPDQAVVFDLTWREACAEELNDAMDSQYLYEMDFWVLEWLPNSRIYPYGENDHSMSKSTYNGKEYGIWLL